MHSTTELLLPLYRDKVPCSSVMVNMFSLHSTLAYTLCENVAYFEQLGLLSRNIFYMGMTVVIFIGNGADVYGLYVVRWQEMAR